MESRIVYANTLEQFEPSEIVDVSYKVRFRTDHYREH